MARSAFKPVWVIFAVLCALVAFSVASRLLQSKEIIPWRSDFRAAQAEALDANKPVLLYFTASWCGPCQTMKRTTWANAEVDAALREFVPVRIDVDQQPIVAESFQIRSVPSYVILSSKGMQQSSESGMMAPDELLKWLNEGMKNPLP